MPKTKAAPARKFGPEKQFHGTMTIRAPKEDLERWHEAASKTPERMSLSQAARGLLNKWADKILGSQ